MEIVTKPSSIKNQRHTVIAFFISIKTKLSKNLHRKGKKS